MLLVVCQLKEQYPVTARAPNFDFWRGCREIKRGEKSKEGGVRVCGIAVLGYFWCGVAVIFISKYGIAVFRVQAVCGKFKFYAAVVGEKIFVSR